MGEVGAPSQPPIKCDIGATDVKVERVSWADVRVCVRAAKVYGVAKTRVREERDMPAGSPGAGSWAAR